MEPHKRAAAEWLLSFPMFCVNLRSSATPTPASRLFTGVELPLGDIESLVRDGLLGLVEFGALEPMRHVPWEPTPPILGHTHCWGDARGFKTYQDWLQGSHRAREWEYRVLVDPPRNEPSEAQKRLVAAYVGVAYVKPQGCSLGELSFREPRQRQSEPGTELYASDGERKARELATGSSD